MDGVIVEFLVGLYFAVHDLPIVISGGKTWENKARFITGIILVLLAIFNINLLNLI